MAKPEAPPPSSPALAYLRDCYRADSREFSLANVFGSRIHFSHFMPDRDDLLDGTFERVLLETEWSETVAKEQALYKRERQLIYGAFFLAGGKVTLGGRAQRLAAPLLYFPARLQEEELAAGRSFFVSIDAGDMRVNVPVLEALLDARDAPDGSLEEVLAQIPPPPFDGSAVFQIVQALSPFLPDINMDGLYRFPALEPRKVLSKNYKEPHLFSASVVALIENSPEARGVLFELDTLVREEDRSSPVRLLLGDGASPVHDAYKAEEVPGLLSSAQEQALVSAATRPLTLVIGPPGTGKTYTIASLALEHLMRNQSVLFVARTRQALDVIQDKFIDLLGTDRLVVRGGRHAYLKELKQFLEELLRGIFPVPLVDEPEAIAARWEQLRKELASQEAALLAMGLEEEGLGRLLCAGDAGLVGAIRKAWLSWKCSRRKPAWALMEAYQTSLEERNRLLRLLLQIRVRNQLQHVLEHHRPALKKFLSAIRARTSSRQEKFFADLDFTALLEALPIWLTDLGGLHRILPMKKDLFDLVVLDEATQCDMASCLPAFQRGRRVVVTGDPKQLRHVSFLSRDRQTLAAEQAGLPVGEREVLNYRDRSALDLVEERITDQTQVAFLDEHFRSRPRIIAFSNQSFYHNQLKVMTRQPGDRETPALSLHVVAGIRREDGTNVEEGAAVLGAIRQLVQEEKNLSPAACQSIGVLSPFRKQADHLRDTIQANLDLGAIEKHRIRVGTAYAFQGEERDRMYLSFAVDSATGSATWRFLNRPDIFNVTITRARHRQQVFVSLPADAIPGNSYLRRYVDWMAATSAPLKAVGDLDHFLEAVQARLQKEGYRLYPAYPVAGLELDLAIAKSGNVLGLDLIGCPGRFAGAFPLERYRMLDRAGLRVIPLPYSRWQTDPEACVEAIGGIVDS